MITLDFSALVAALNERDPNHQVIISALQDEPGDLLLPCVTLAEIGHFLGKQRPPARLDTVLDDLQKGRLVFDCGDQDLPRVRELSLRYEDLPLGLVDAGVIACAERNGGRVATLDYRHFGVVAREGTIEIVNSTPGD